MIKEFRGPYRFLSNFILCDIWLDSIKYPSVEHAYQAAKTLNKTQRHFIRTANSAGEAKRRGQKATLRIDWEDIKISVMEDLVKQKFTHPELKKQLLATGDKFLQEGNNWHDTFWGIDLKRNTGFNHLGRILMKVRGQIRNELGNS